MLIGLVLLYRLLIVPNFVHDGRSSPALNCVNRLRIIGGAKEEWALEHPGHTNDIVEPNDLTNYIRGMFTGGGFKLDRHGRLLGCPLGGIYTIGKIGEPATCSLGTNVTPAHVLE